MSEGMRLIDGEDILGSVVVNPFGSVSSPSRSRRKKVKRRSGKIRRIIKRVKRKIIPGRRKATRSRAKKGIRFTKNGQPFKIMANGRARFIKKKGVRR